MSKLRKSSFILIGLLFPIFVFASTVSTEVVDTTPTGLTATVISASQVNLSWTEVADAVSYTVYRDSVSLATTTEVTYSDTTVVNETTYGYTVSSINTYGGESAECTEVSAIVDIVSGSTSIPVTTQSSGPTQPVAPAPEEEEEEEEQQEQEEEKEVVQPIVEVEIPEILEQEPQDSSGPNQPTGLITTPIRQFSLRVQSSGGTGRAFVTNNTRRIVLSKGEKFIFSIPGDYFGINVRAVFLVIRSDPQTFILIYNEETGNYEAEIAVDFEEGEHSLNLGVIYDDSSTEAFETELIVEDSPAEDIYTEDVVIEDSPIENIYIEDIESENVEQDIVKEEIDNTGSISVKEKVFPVWIMLLISLILIMTLAYCLIKYKK